MGAAAPGQRGRCCCHESVCARGLNYPHSTVISDSPHVRMGLLATGRFLSIFPASALRFCAGQPEVRTVPLKTPFGRVPVGIVMLKGRTLGPVARLFIEHGRELAESLTRAK